MEMRQEKLETTKVDVAKRYDTWAVLAVQYNLLDLGLRTEFYQLPAEYPTYTKLVYWPSIGVERVLQLTT